MYSVRQQILEASFLSIVAAGHSPPRDKACLLADGLERTDALLAGEFVSPSH